MPAPAERGNDQTDAQWAAAQAAFVTAVQTYETVNAAYLAAIESARAKVDRVAYAGKVPVNVAATNVGDFIVAAQNGDGISGQSIAASAITFAQYRMAVGRVRRIIDAGHCEVAVIVH